MNKLLKYIIFILWILSFNTWLAYESYEDYKSIELIWAYLENHKTNIEKIINQYELEDDKQIKNEIEKINYLLESIDKIKKSNIDEEKNDKIVQTIINEIKTINNNLKSYLINKIEKYNKDMEKDINLYHSIWIKLAVKLDLLYEKFYNNDLDNKKILTVSESKLKNSVNNLNKISKKLKNFDQIKFTKKEEIKESFLRLLKELKDDIKIIKTNYK